MRTLYNQVSLVPYKNLLETIASLWMTFEERTDY